MTLDLDFMKNYLRVDHDEDDGFIHLLLRASASFVETYLNEKLSNYGYASDGTPLYPAEFDIARLQIMAQWYDERTIMSPRSNVKELAYVFTDLLDPHRNWQFAFIGSGLQNPSPSDMLNSIYFNPETGLFYRAEVVDTYTALTGDIDLSNAPNTMYSATTDAVDYNQQMTHGE